MLVGIDCIAVVYSLIGRSWLVWPLKVEALNHSGDPIYRWFARNRYRASRGAGLSLRERRLCRLGRT